jgi:adenine-specific DNA-methyltransferase
MEGRVGAGIASERPWQVELCQFFTREKVPQFCLEQFAFPKNVLSVKVLEPAAGHGAFFLPLVPRLVQACRTQKRSYAALRPIVRAYEIDASVADELRKKTADALQDAGVPRSKATMLARYWIKHGDFLEARITSRFTHVVGNPPYIRWDAIPADLRRSYRAKFRSFKQRADLYIAFIERALRLLQPEGQLGFLCPGTWTKNAYGGSIREALTSQGHLQRIIDFSDVDSFETSADAYPHFFVFQKGGRGATEIFSMTGAGQLRRTGRAVSRNFSPSDAPLVLSRDQKVAQTLKRAREKFPKLQDAGCCVRVGSATGCNDVFLGRAEVLPVERSRLLPFVNACSIQDASVKWSDTSIVNVFDDNGKLVRLAHFPQLAAYLRKHKKRLKTRAKASQSKIWWRSIDCLHPDWYRAAKLLVVDISASPVIGLDNKGYCAGGGVYQIKSDSWPLKDLLVFLSAGVLGLFVAGLSAGAARGFHRFQKTQISAIPIPRWEELDPRWRKKFRTAHRRGRPGDILAAVAELYECDPKLLAAHVARDWRSFSGRRKA